jgi:hypothetical protein
MSRADALALHQDGLIRSHAFTFQRELALPSTFKSSKIILSRFCCAWVPNDSQDDGTDASISRHVNFSIRFKKLRWIARLYAMIIGRKATSSSPRHITASRPTYDILPAPHFVQPRKKSMPDYDCLNVDRIWLACSATQRAGFERIVFANISAGNDSTRCRFRGSRPNLIRESTTDSKFTSRNYVREWR